MRGRVRIAAAGTVAMLLLCAVSSDAGAQSSTWSVQSNGGFVSLDLLNTLQFAGGGSEADASRVESCEKVTELTSLWPSSVYRQALHLSPIAGFIVIHFGSSSLKRPLVRLRAGLNTSADAYA